MPNVDENGNKIAARKEKKSILSQRKRESRKLITPEMPNFNKNICNVCGFRIRGENHLNGKHHKSAENKLVK